MSNQSLIDISLIPYYYPAKYNISVIIYPTIYLYSLLEAIPLEASKGT